MHGLKQMLLEEQAYLTQLIQNVSSEISTHFSKFPANHIRISHCNGTIQYYQVGKDIKNKNGVYIPKDDMDFVHQLAQKDYDEELLRLASKRLKQIQRITKDYEDFEFEQIYLSKSAHRQGLIKPYRPTWQQIMNKWLNQEYTGKGFDESAPVIYTDKGERVRSKSEKILADYFYHNDIPYLYEKPVHLSNNITIYPDFSFLSREKRKEIYWEHLGRMDDPAYVNSIIKKISTYEANGIYPGERLILTFETKEIYLSTNEIERLCDKYLRD